MSVQGYSLSSPGTCPRVLPPVLEHCPIDGAKNTFTIPGITSADMEEWKRRLENSLLMSVERRSFLCAGLLMGVTMTILLVGTCILSCRDAEIGSQYELLMDQDNWEQWANLLHADPVNLKSHLYGVPFRDGQDS